MCVGKDTTTKAVTALKQYCMFLLPRLTATKKNRAHPYEEPAYEVYEMEDF